MPTLKTRLEALESRAQGGDATFCLVVHGKDGCIAARETAVAEYTALHGVAPVNFCDVYFVSAVTKKRVCKCAPAGTTECEAFRVTGPDRAGIVADMLKQADGTALQVVKE